MVEWRVDNRRSTEWAVWNKARAGCIAGDKTGAGAGAGAGRLKQGCEFGTDKEQEA